MNRPVLKGRTLLLRAPKDSDIAERLALGDPPEIVRMFGVDPATVRPIDRIRTGAWLRFVRRHPHAWIIEHEGRLLGEARLDDLDRDPGVARLAIGFYDPAKLGRGLGREAIRLVLAYAFGPLRLHRVGLRVIAYNVRAIRCYAACGFVEEGREREVAYIDGAWHDDVLMGLLAGEFTLPA